VRTEKRNALDCAFNDRGINSHRLSSRQDWYFSNNIRFRRIELDGPILEMSPSAVCAFLRCYDLYDQDLLQLRGASICSLLLTGCSNVTSSAITTLVATLHHLRTLYVIGCESVHSDILQDVPPLCSTLRTFVYSRNYANRNCVVYDPTTAAHLLQKVLSTMYPHVAQFSISLYVFLCC